MTRYPAKPIKPPGSRGDDIPLHGERRAVTPPIGRIRSARTLASKAHPRNRGALPAQASRCYRHLRHERCEAPPACARRRRAEDDDPAASSRMRDRRAARSSRRPWRPSIHESSESAKTNAHAPSIAPVRCGPLPQRPFFAVPARSSPDSPQTSGSGIGGMSASHSSNVPSSQDEVVRSAALRRRSVPHRGQACRLRRTLFRGR